MLTSPSLITVSPEILSGMPVFKGTRVPVKTLFDHIEAGDSLDVFLGDFPSVSREMAIAVLEQAQFSLLETVA
jgi:uncharacterized protein (DUF433 family)